jgi:hypothetical protein
LGPREVRRSADLVHHGIGVDERVVDDAVAPLQVEDPAQ